MQKESNYLSSSALLGGSLFASGFYLASFYFAPTVVARIFLITTVALGALAMIKILNTFAPQFPIPLNRAVCWLHSMAFEACAITLSFLMRPLGILGTGSRCGTEAGRPILLIHGYMQNGSNWAYLKRRLCQKGFGPVFTLNLGHPFRSIRDYAEIISKKAVLIAKETGREDLTLIGHSMGGLVSAWYATKVAPPGKVGDVITIGSPLGGTKMASIAIGKNAREMRRGSDFVREVAEVLRKNRKVRFYHIASKADQIILPYSSALTGQHPEREYVLDDLGHMTLLYSVRVADKIEKWLSSARRF